MSDQPSRTAIITGAASGLGREYALLLAGRGWELAVADIDPAGLSETCEAVRQAGGHVRAEQLSGLAA